MLSIGIKALAMIDPDEFEKWHELLRAHDNFPQGWLPVPEED